MFLDSGLAYTGQIVSLDAIPNADLIVCATVTCGEGGTWRGVVRKKDFRIGDFCTVYLPDALIPSSEDMKFMEHSGWRVRMQRFRGAPSEVVIVPLKFLGSEVGKDCTALLGVQKYYKPVPSSLNGEFVDAFPAFIPKTDEPNYQASEELVKMLEGKPFYISEKMDGASTTAYRYKGHFGVCNRNWELARNEENGYWKVAIAHNLEQTLPEGFAIQWETCGPGIQGNLQKLNEISGYAFSAYNIEERRYLEMHDFIHFCLMQRFTWAKIHEAPECFSARDIQGLLEDMQPDNTREGVVIRSTTNLLGHKPISFKVLNLSYKH